MTANPGNIQPASAVPYSSPTRMAATLPQNTQSGIPNIPITPTASAGNGGVASPTISRKPAPNRRYVKGQFLAIPGLREIPENTPIPCTFPQDLDVNQLNTGDKFTVAVTASRSHVGSAQHLSRFPKGTLVEFQVTSKQASTPTDEASVETRAACFLIPDRNDPNTDIAIEIPTATLLHPEDFGPSESNRFESARRGQDMTANLFQATTHNPNAYFTGGAFGHLGGYFLGRMKENAAGVSQLSGKIDAGTEVALRLNRRILF